MKEKKLIVVKRISKGNEINDKNLGHCTFWGIERNEAVACQLDNERMIDTALKEGNQVLAVSSAVILAPLAFEVAESGGITRWRVADVMHVKIDAACQAFRDEFISKLSEGEIYYDTDLWNRLNLEAHFKHLINGQKAAQLAAHGSGVIDSSQFNVADEIRPNMPDWCVYQRDEGMVVDSANAPYSQTWLKALAISDKEERLEEARKGTVRGIWEDESKEIVRKWLRDSLQSLKNHPFATISLTILVLLMLYYGHGCISSFNEKQEKSREQERVKWDVVKPVKGAISVKTSALAADERAAKLLKGEAESFARDTIADVSSKTKAWRDGGKIELPAKSWAAIVTRVQKFAAESAGEFTCEVSGNDITVVAHPEVVKSYTLDVDLLRTDAAAIGVVSKAFGVSFGGQTRLGPMPIRSAKRKAALKALDGTQVKVELGGDKSEIVFAPNLAALSRNDPSAAGMTDAELSKKADAFWRDVAAEKFSSIPKAYEDIRLRFSALDHEFTDGFEAAERDLAVLLDDIAQKKQECAVFLAECGAPWRQYSAAMPSDKNAKVRTVREAQNGLDALKKSAQARYDRVSFDKDIAQFKKNKEQFIFWSGEMIKVYNAQQARLAQISQLRQNMANALNARNFSQIAAFESSIADFENAQRANRTREVQIGQYVQSICSVNYFDQTFGQKWMKAIIRKYAAKVAGVDLLTQKTVADFSSDIQRLFGAATLDKALDHGRRLSESVIDNHKEARDGKTLSEMGAEIALVCGLRNDLSVLKRAQRKFGQQ